MIDPLSVISDFYVAYFVSKIEFFLHLGCNGVEARGLNRMRNLHRM